MKAMLHAEPKSKEERDRAYYDSMFRTTLSAYLIEKDPLEKNYLLSRGTEFFDKMDPKSMANLYLDLRDKYGNTTFYNDCMYVYFAAMSGIYRPYVDRMTARRPQEGYQLVMMVGGLVNRILGNISTDITNDIPAGLRSNFDLPTQYLVEKLPEPQTIKKQGEPILV